MKIKTIQEELEQINTRALELQVIFEERPWTEEELREIHKDADRDMELRGLLGLLK